MAEHGRSAGKRGFRTPVAAPRTLAIAFATMLVTPMIAAGETTDARALAAHALSLRNAAASGEATALSILADIPGAASAQAPELLWPPFFANAMVKLGRLRSARPAALYYNPLLDVGLIAQWERTEDGYRVGSARLFPGERPAVPADEVPLQPSWMSAAEGPLAGLRALAAARLDSFGRNHPVAATDAASDDASFATASREFRAALPRLAWNVLERTRWAGSESSWLGPVLTHVERALELDDAAAVKAMAPETDDATATTLAQLPAGFARGLVLDMAVGGDGERLLIGSRPEDGDTYVLVLCRFDGAACALRRLMLVSLSE